MAVKSRVVLQHYEVNPTVLTISDYVSALPTASASYRGKIVYKYGGTSVADTLNICIKKADDGYAWYTIDLTVVS